MKKLIPVRLPPGRARLATRPSLTGSSATLKTIGIVVVAALAANAAASSGRGDHGDLCGEPVRPPAPAADRVDSRPSGIRSPRSRPRHSRSPSGPGEMRADGPRLRRAMWREEPDHRHRRLLRARRERPRRRAAEQRDELAPSHVEQTLPAGIGRRLQSGPFRHRKVTRKSGPS